MLELFSTSFEVNSISAFHCYRQILCISDVLLSFLVCSRNSDGRLLGTGISTAILFFVNVTYG